MEGVNTSVSTSWVVLNVLVKPVINLHLMEDRAMVGYLFITNYNQAIDPTTILLAQSN